MNGQEVFQFALKTVPELARSLLDKAGMDRDQIDWYVLHQANHRILEGVAKRMKVPMERFYENIGRYGNTSAATIPIALDEMAAAGAAAAGTVDHVPGLRRRADLGRSNVSVVRSAGRSFRWGRGDDKQTASRGGCGRKP